MRHISAKKFLEISQHKKIVCFGAGKMFQRFIKELEAWEKEVCFVIDNSIKEQDKYLMCKDQNIRVTSPKILLECDKSETIIVVTSVHYRSMNIQLKELGWDENIYCYPFQGDIVKLKEDKDSFRKERIVEPAEKMLEQYIFDAEIDKVEADGVRRRLQEVLKNEESLVLPYAVTVVTSKCTLRCRDCNNLIPYQKKGRDLDKELILKDIEAMCDAMDLCVCMNITGGEPFLYADLGEIVSVLTAKENILFVEIITNGTLLPKEEWLAYLRNPKVMIRISNYGRHAKVSEVADYLRNQGIRVWVSCELIWITSGGVERRGKDEIQKKKEYLNCWSGMYCKSIWAGKLYACARAAFLHEMQASVHTSDYVTLEQPDLKTRIQEFLLTDYVDACDFCDHMNECGRQVEAAIQVGEGV